MKNIKCDII